MSSEIEEYKKVMKVDTSVIHKVKGGMESFFTSSEIEIYEKRLNSLVSRMMIKELLMDVVEISDAYKEIEILANEKGKPEIDLSERLKGMLNKKGYTSYDCSISHSKNVVATLLVLFRE